MKNEELERFGACALNRIFGYEPLTASRLISALGSAGAVFSLSKTELLELAGPFCRHLELINDDELEKSRSELARLEDSGCTFIPCTSPDYPQSLLQCEDHPSGLYVRSHCNPGELFNRRATVSIVGTRDMSLYGKEWCTRIVAALSRTAERPTIASGLALGVDITAHLAAMGFNLPTIAVLPTGIDDIYPRRHSVAAGKIVSSPYSALVTDFPPGTGPRACTFLRRNRIIAGLGTATVLIESKAKGGGMITSRMAFDYGREVYALPGRVDDIRSAGCNVLIAEKIAEPVLSPDLLAASLFPGLAGASHKISIGDRVKAYYVQKHGEERSSRMGEIAAIVEKHRGITIEEICGAAELEYREAALLTGLLENDGFIDIDLMQRCMINAKNS